MQSGSSSTQVFYHLMDLDEQQKQQFLYDLKIQQPNIYQEIASLIKHETTEQISELFNFHVQQATQPEWDFSHQTIGKYQLTEELGRGGIGVVYSAYRADGTFEQELAIKFIQPVFTNVLNKHALFAEAQLLARLNHPCIAKVFDGGQHQDLLYLVMEKITGSTLNLFLEQNVLSKKQKLALFTHLCQALEHAHQHQVLHADLKPENILIDEQGAPKLIDFNLTQKVRDGATNNGQVILAYSEHYASPEQKAGHYLTQQSDVYSLGKILLLLFNDELPSSDITTVQLKASAENIDARYASVSKLHDDIELIQACRPIMLKRHIPFYVLRCFIKRRPIQSLLAASLLLASVAFFVILTQQNYRLEREKKLAESMVYEITSLLFHAKSTAAATHISVNSMLELTRRRVLSNPALPAHIKQKMLLAMMTPIPEKNAVTHNNPSNSNYDTHKEITK